MKKFLQAIAIALALGAQLPAMQAQNNDAHASPPAAAAAENGNSATASEGTATGNKAATEKTDEATKPTAPPSASGAAATAAATLTPTTSDGNGPAAATTTTTTDAPAKTVVTVPGAPPAATTPAAAAQNPATVASAPATATPPAPTDTYRVGVGDVLDIRLLNANTSGSTLFTVMEGGLLEYPLAGDPLAVAGLTTDEIAGRITTGIKIYDKPQVVVAVRQYASHSVMVAGLVEQPGAKALRREAVPLYVLLAEAQPRPEAARATIMRGASPITIDLGDSTATATLVYPGDVITLSVAPPKPPQYYFIGGQINSPGQKDFHAGLTLTQAILASGGPSRFAGNKVKVSRQGADGRLVTTEYNLKQIENGKVPDPLLQPGDRLEITRGGW
ncbi:MAG TPA: polysaccharide biosynthesis/export family protein [Pyrinomonadaceae bacterium]|jgi:protein involved in polysaccharide export with SLBB domain|nr:polysaccharide biosynthesis/export family protein [Pyrinomonadaceae bacterium]